MKLSELVIEIIHHLKKGPFVKVVPARLKDFASRPVPIIPDENSIKNELMIFNNLTESLLDDLTDKVESSEDYVLNQEQLLKLEDAKALLKRNRLVSDTSNQLNSMLYDGYIEKYHEREERIQLFIDVLKKRLDAQKRAGLKPLDYVEFDVEKDGLTKGLKIGGLELSLSGADLAFFMQVFRKAGWFKEYGHKALDGIFADMLDQNSKVLKNKEYIFLKHFMSKLSYAKSVESDQKNEEREREFKSILTATIKNAQETFLDDKDTWDISKI